MGTCESLENISHKMGDTIKVGCVVVTVDHSSWNDDVVMLCWDGQGFVFMCWRVPGMILDLASHVCQGGPDLYGASSQLSRPDRAQAGTWRSVQAVDFLAFMG